MPTKEEMIALYDKAKFAKIGEPIFCPGCGVEFTKKTSQQAFCSNGRTQGAGNCKDAYWNKVDESKRNRKHPKSHYNKYNVGDKSPEAAQSRIDGLSDYDRDFYAECDYPEGWDEHKD